MVEGLDYTPTRNLYLDTCIYLYAWDTEVPSNRVCFASKQIMSFIRNEIFTLYVSEMVVREISENTPLSYNGAIAKISDELSLGSKLKVIKANYRMLSEAIRIWNEYFLHYPDYIHAGIAKVLDCVLVTQDGFLLRVSKRDGIDSRKPEEFAFANSVSDPRRFESKCGASPDVEGGEP